MKNAIVKRGRPASKHTAAVRNAVVKYVDSVDNESFFTTEILLKKASPALAANKITGSGRRLAVCNAVQSLIIAGKVAKVGVAEKTNGKRGKAPSLYARIA